jgi:hypothetical protein
MYSPVVLTSAGCNFVAGFSINHYFARLGMLIETAL